jgi:prepilin-type N-terminal cleavage/methylation domain-containing protein
MRYTNPKSQIKNRESKMRAFTLIEMLISLAIMAVIAAALGSTIVLASKALDQEAGPGASTVAARRATDRLLAELTGATAFSERTANAITFTVPDRDGDGSPETIRYAWSGVAGEPLTRQYNGGVPDVVAEDVRQFDLGYLLRTVDPPAARETESSEQILIAHDRAKNNGDLQEKSIRNKEAGGAWFRPALPAGAVRWKVTKVEFVTRRSSLLATGSVSVDVTSATATLQPGSEVLDTANIAASSLPMLAGWKSVPFTSSKLQSLAPGQGLCFVVRSSDNGTQAFVQYERDGDPMTPNTHWLSWDSTRGWSGAQDTSDMRIKVWGTVTTLSQ